MTRYYIKEVPVFPVFDDGRCMTRYEIWADYGQFWNFVLNACSCLSFGHFRDTTVYSYNKESAEKKMKEYVKFKQMGG